MESAGRTEAVAWVSSAWLRSAESLLGEGKLVRSHQTGLAGEGHVRWTVSKTETSGKTVRARGKDHELRGQNLPPG